MRGLPLRLRKYFVYILQSESDSGFYIGYTSNLRRRIREHNLGKTRSLRHRRPLKLVYFEEHSSKSEAEARERQIKSWKGGAAFGSYWSRVRPAVSGVKIEPRSRLVPLKGRLVRLERIDGVSQVTFYRRHEGNCKSRSGRFRLVTGTYSS